VYIVSYPSQQVAKAGGVLGGISVACSATITDCCCGRVCTDGVCTSIVNVLDNAKALGGMNGELGHEGPRPDSVELLDAPSQPSQEMQEAEPLSEVKEVEHKPTKEVKASIFEKHKVLLPVLLSAGVVLLVLVIFGIAVIMYRRKFSKNKQEREALLH
jgi:hypothetical protein